VLHLRECQLGLNSSCLSLLLAVIPLQLLLAAKGSRIPNMKMFGIH